MPKTKIDPKEHDTKLAALYFDLDEAQRYLNRARARVINSAGIKEHRFGKDTKRGWGSEDEYYPYDVAVERVKDKSLLGEVDHAEAETASLENQIFNLEAQYTGWSRFFLVTSSQGHIHSSMRCHTCYDTTTYGWLPELSGKTSGEAVDELGPALCSSCFPGAGTQQDQWSRDQISESQARKLAWSPDRDEKAAKAAAEKAAKAEAKIKKAASKLKYDESLAHKVNALVDLGLSDNETYEWTWDHKGFDNAYFVYSDMQRRRAARS